MTNDQRLNLLCRNQLLADLDIDDISFLGVLGLYVSHTDTHFRVRQHDTGSHVSDHFACLIADLITVTRDRTLQTLEMHEFALDAFRFLLFQEIAVNEGEERLEAMHRNMAIDEKQYQELKKSMDQARQEFEEGKATFDRKYPYND